MLKKTKTIGALLQDTRLAQLCSLAQVKSLRCCPLISGSIEDSSKSHKKICTQRHKAMRPDIDKKLVVALSILILLPSMAQTSKSISTSSAVNLGVKAGDWIKLNYTFVSASNTTFPPSNGSFPTWIKVEILSVNTTQASVDIRMTVHMTDGTEQNQTGTLNLTAGADTGPVLSGLVIPANLEVGDSTYMTGYGNVVITSETTGTYVGASRSIVHANFSQQANQLTFSWDKQTGVIVEANITSGSTNATLRAVETNMWQPQLFGIPIDPTVLYPLIAVVVILVVVAFALRHRKKPTKETPSEKIASNV